MAQVRAIGGWDFDYTALVGDIVILRVSAANAYGYGIPSADNVPETSTAVRWQPHAPLEPTFIYAEISLTSITVHWLTYDAPENGNMEILMYNLNWDNAAGGDPSISLVDALVT
jgi:hypothetical protein